MPAKEFHVKQGLLPIIADNFSIKTSCGKDVYRVKGNEMPWGTHSSFQTMDGTELASLKEKKTYSELAGTQLRHPNRPDLSR